MRSKLTKTLWPYLSILLTLLLVPVFTSRQQSAQSTLVDQGSTDKVDRAQLHQALLDLTNPFTVLCVAAHPDDEDGSTLTVMRRKYGAHTVSLFSTFGEGGQNAVGPELYEELGVIRARETIAASEVQGSEPHFLGMRDFGFSKSAEETFRAWGEKETLRRMVFQIRKLRPDVIITNHNTSGGHGHHQATGRLLLQAFDAAADPTQFPEQLGYAPVWQTQRLFVRGGRGPEPTPPNPAGKAAPLQTFTIDPNELDPVRGVTYAQQALSGLQKHATQGPWPKTVSPNGARIVRYSLVRQVPSAAPLPDDAKTPIDGLRLPESINARLVAPTIDGKPLTEFLDKRGEILVSLVNARKRGAFKAAKEVTDLDPQRFKLMTTRLDAALAASTGVTLTINSPETLMVPGEKIAFEISLANAGEDEILIKRLVASGFSLEKKLEAADKLLPGTDTSQAVNTLTPKSARINIPLAEHLYDGELLGEPFRVESELEVGGARYIVASEKRMDVAPAVQIINNNASPCVETPATLLRCTSASLTLISHLKTPFKGFITLKSPLAGHKSTLTKEVSLNAKEAQRFVSGPISSLPPREQQQYGGKGQSIKVELIAADSKRTVTEKVLPAVYIPAVAPAGLSVGYVPSTDSTLKDALAALGVNAKALSSEDVTKADLSSFNTIIIDNRAYEIHRELIAVNDRLLKYVEDGGTMLVFYHKTNEWNPDERQKRPQLAPYPITVGNARVTEEDAHIGILQPRHPLLNSPNRITQEDFAGWVQERGLYYPSQWDQHYTALLTTPDKGESPLNGGLLVAQYGKGNYIYTSMVWYRQLREGIPGGYRFFANLISYGKGRPEGSKPTVIATP